MKNGHVHALDSPTVALSLMEDTLFQKNTI